MSQGRSREVLPSVGNLAGAKQEGGRDVEGSRRVWTFLELGEDGERHRCWSLRSPLPALRTGAHFSGPVVWTTFATTYTSHPLVLWGQCAAVCPRLD